MNFYLLSLCLFANLNAFAEGNPYKNVEIERLSNGLTLVSAPGEKSDMFEIRVQVAAGHRNEVWGKAGVAHLLEHYLFWDPSLAANTTYLDVIKEKGGSGNAVTSYKTTTYYASIKKAEAPWLVNTFAKILFQKTFQADAVELAKKPVYLEIGKPNIFHFVSPSNSLLFRKLTHVPSLYETEFGITADHSYHKGSSPVIDTASLRVEDLKEFYQLYYRPDQIKVFVAGGFDRAKLLPQLRTLFGAEPARKGPTFPAENPVAKIRPYRWTSVTSSSRPRIEIGAKVANLSAREEMVSDIYLKYVSHKLMKELRNRRGEAYTVYPSSHFHEKHGIISVNFETSEEQYYENLRYADAIIENETRKGNISMESFQEAMKLYESEFHVDGDADSLMGIAGELADFHEKYPGSGLNNPYELYKSIQFADFQTDLKNLFRKEMTYEVFTAPPYFFRFEIIPISLLSFIFFMGLSKRIFARSFPNMQIRWVRKIRYFPGYVVQMSSLGISLILGTVGTSFVFTKWAEWRLMQFSGWISDYLPLALSLGITVFSFQIAMMLVARKAIITKDTLWVKSLGYWSYVYRLDQIARVEMMHPIKFLVSPVRLYRTGIRFWYYFDLSFWKSGIYLELKNGKGIYLSLSEPHLAYEEIRSLLNESKNESVSAPVQKTEPETKQAA